MLEAQELITLRQRQAAEKLLSESGLLYPEQAEFGLGWYEDGALLATGFLAGNVIMGVCVHPSRRGEGLSSIVVGRLVTEAVRRGCSKLFLFTKPVEARNFTASGFNLVASAGNHAALLEWGRPSFEDWVKTLKKEIGHESRTPVGAAVINANPFTKGHLSLLERAAKKCCVLFVFVVQQDSSTFPFTVRLDLVRRGAAHIPNCRVFASGPYMVSRQTFPAYFTGKEKHAAAHAALDIEIFSRRIAPEFCITKRFVGTEPYCPVTALYNHVMRERLPQAGIALHELERLESDSRAVSASALRKALREDDWPLVERLAPPTTLEFLRSPEAHTIIDALRASHSRH